MNQSKGESDAMVSISTTINLPPKIAITIKVSSLLSAQRH